MLSIIIPTRNAAQTIQPLLDAIKHQASDSEIIVIDSASTDNTVELAQAHGARVISIDCRDFDHGTTRNLAARQAAGEFMIFFTQDAIPADDHTIEELLKPLKADSAVAASYARQIPRPDAHPTEKFARQFNYPDTSLVKSIADIDRLGIKTFFCSNSCCAVRRSVFEKLGSFQSGVGTNEDMLFAARAIRGGFKIAYAADARVIHSHNFTLLQLFKRYRQIGKFFARFGPELASTAGRGAGMVSAGIKHFCASHEYCGLLLFLTQTVVKAVGFYSGKIGM